MISYFKNNRRLKIFLLTVFLISFPLLALAGYYDDSLVPCGVKDKWCTLCDFVLLAKKIFEFLLKVSLAFSILIGAIVGILYVISAGSEKQITNAKNGFKLSLWGFALCLFSWLLVNLVAKTMGYQEQWWSLNLECKDYRVPMPPDICPGGGIPINNQCPIVDPACQNKKEGDSCTKTDGEETIEGYCYSGQCLEGDGKKDEPCGDNGGTCAKDCSDGTTDWGGRNCESGLVCCKKKIAGSGYCTEENLNKYCPGGSANVAKAICICKEESGGSPTVCGDKICPDKQGAGTGASCGLFQINLTKHSIGGTNCPSGFKCEKPQFDIVRKCMKCDILNPGTYSACKTSATDPETNIKYACQLSGNWTNFSQWSTNAKCQ
jgi:hypothetical protein